MATPTHTVTVAAVVTTTDALGNGTETSTPTTVNGIRFAPEGLVENAGTATPRVIGDATLYGVLPPLDSDDTVTHEAPCCDGADFTFGAWQVVGGAKGWGSGRKVVPIRRTATS